MLGDDFYIDYSKPALKQLIDKLDLNDGIISSEIRNKEDMVSKGMIIEKDGLVIDLVEKPKIDQVTSKYAISGRYIVPRKIFEYLNSITPSKRGEIELTDALLKCVNSGLKINHAIIDGKRLDVGTPEEYLRANIEYAKSNKLI